MKDFHGENPLRYTFDFRVIENYECPLRYTIDFRVIENYECHCYDQHIHISIYLVQYC